MKTAIAFPRRYVQGRGVLAEIDRQLAPLGRAPLLLWGPRTRAAVGETVVEALERAGLAWCEVGFGGECTRAEAARVAREAAESGADLLVAFGGGKAIDAGKGAAAQAGLPVAVIPTIASNDAPTSAVSVWYDESGACVGYDVWKHNPDLVLVDSAVIARAPGRTLAAGIGDALATWPEAQAADRGGANALAGGRPTRTALTMARLCYDTLLADGLEALQDTARGEPGPALERVIEANVLLSGVGWESGGLACAHAIANFLPWFSETHRFMHGEKVAFGLCCQLCLEQDRSQEEVLHLVDFMLALGLPVDLAGLGLADLDPERLAAFSRLVAAEGSFVHNHPFAVGAEDVARAVMAADALGRRRRAT